ncbi:DUF3010 family protein [Shewanella litorisediminis]|uniref:DUF3010 family protein n=1 Tax=Shewanella litorisediminis TaxID=1173586 RepID=A0ABX7G6V2_9GAMM|nr:DUF3010 family protein [Shewanella litorisediminis]MCL2916825.1 DUF3010 family protein [Shewanella litorisediminis]QRH03007.1 DUF3010 family protein [Shewanella litorisediminis]
MRVCGVELKGAEAIISLVGYDKEAFNVPECRKHSFVVNDADNQEAIREFHFAFAKLMADYKVEHIVIVEREQKGKLAGSAIGFKLEAAIQLGELPVTLLKPTAIREQCKRNPPQVDYEVLGLKRFQLQAFEAGYAFLNARIYGKL